MLMGALAAKLTVMLETRTQRRNKCSRCRKSKWAECRAKKIKVDHATIGTNSAPRGIAKINVREESENGGEQEAAIPLTGGLVRSVMV